MICRDTPPMGGWMGSSVGQWVGSGHITKYPIILDLIEIIQFCLNIYDLLDILDFFLDILLKPPQPLMGLFFLINLRAKWAPVFVLNLKYWYLSKTIPFLKCPLVPTFLLLIKARRCNQKMEMFSLNEPFTWEFFVLLFCIPVHIQLQSPERKQKIICKNLFIFKKEKMKWDENETLCWIMRWGWMTWKWSLAFNNDDGKKLYNLKIYLQKKINK